MNIECRYIKHLKYSNDDGEYDGIIIDIIMAEYDKRKSPNELINSIKKYLWDNNEILYDDIPLIQINIYNLINNDIIKNVFRMVHLLESYYGFGITIYFGLNKKSKQIIIRKLSESYDNLIIKTPSYIVLQQLITNNNDKSYKHLRLRQKNIILNTIQLYNKYRNIL